MKLLQILGMLLFISSLHAQVQITFRVDMSEENVSPAGVHVAGTFQAAAGFGNDWNPSSTQLFDVNGDQIYERTVSVSPGTYLFKYINGDNWGGAELPTPDCSIHDGNGNFNRPVVAQEPENVLDPICFNACAPCGENPNTTYNPITDYEPKWWNDAVFYEIFVRSFKDSDGDGIGDFQGIIDQLDYLNDGDPNTDTDLGITGIWLMPMMPSPSYHGYDVTDYRAVEPDYGTMEDFQAFLDAAHARGIKVIIDFVMNHSSSQHPWFQSSRSNPNSPYRDWYRWEDNNPNQSGPWGQNVWHNYQGDYYFGIFWGGMPDLNYETQAVRDEIYDITRFWLEDVGVDGFRIDAVRYLVEEGANMSSTGGTFDVLEEFNAVYKSANPDALSVGEVWTNSLEVIQYVEDGDRMDLCFEFDLASGILGAVNSGDPDNLGNQLKFLNLNYPPLQMATFLTNHDIDRVYGILGTSASKMKLAASLYLTLPGVPFLYYGEEIGMLGSGPDENKRKPMQWNESANGGFTTGNPWYPLNSNYTSFNVEEFQADDNSIWNHYQKMIKIRTTQEPLRRGYYMPIESSASSTLAFGRVWEDEAVISVHNFSTGMVNNVTLDLGATTLSPGLYYAHDLYNDQELGTLVVDSEGGFSGWALNATLGTRESWVIRLTQTPNSVEDLNNMNQLVQLSPNPVNDWLTIEKTIDQALQLKVFNAVGQLIDQQSINESTKQLNLSAYTNGIYFFHFWDGERTYVQKLLKQ